MIKYAIKVPESNNHAHFIFHATPNEINYHWQWYITSHKNYIGKPIENAIGESYTTTTGLIEEQEHDELYLYCKYIDIKTNKEKKSDYIKLFSDINKMINAGILFDEILAYDENGNIVENELNSN